MDKDSLHSSNESLSGATVGGARDVKPHFTRFAQAARRKRQRSRQPVSQQQDLFSMPQSRPRKDIISRKDHVVRVDREKIYRATQHHHEYTYNGTTLTGLVKFDDCTDYGISEDAEQALLKIEVDRLAEAAENDGPCLFDAQGQLKPTGDEAYDELAHLADQISCNMEVIRLDNARISLEHCEGDSDKSAEIFRTARRRLRGRFKHEQTHVQGAEPKILHPPDRNQVLYFALVDYITACIARLLVRTAESAYWDCHTLSILASFAVKLKVLSHDPARYANFSIDTAEHAIEQLSQGFASKQAMFIKIRVDPSDEKASDLKDVDTLDSETDVSTRYYEEKTYFRSQVRRLVKYTMDNLAQDKDNRSSSGCFEICSLIYRCGIDGALSTLSSNRLGEIAASSDPFRLKCTFTALELTMINLFRLKADADSAPGPAVAHDQKTVIKWEWNAGDSGAGGSKGELATANLDHVISFAVPFSLGITYATDSLDSLVSLAGSGTSDDDPVRQFSPPSKAVRALVSVSTAKWRDRESKIHDDEIQNLPNSPIRFGVRAGTLDLRKYSQKHESVDASTDAKTSKALRQYELDKRQMDTWEASEEAVTIQVKVYTRAIMVLAALIVCGGMSVPFAVGSRIRGVDPFQITTFAWVLAGFLAIFAKSRYVSEWPWHDFIHGRVVCRSVQDVCDVTRVDPQMVLMYLLLEEQVTTLRTKGPYNGMFSRRSEDAGGFTIDEPTHISTMLASGFLVLKVLNEFGEHLVCLDVRKGTKGEAPLLHGTREYLACMDLDNEVDDRLLNEPESPGPPPTGEKHQGRKATKSVVAKEWVRVDKVKKLKKTQFRINKVLGLFVANARFG